MGASSDVPALRRGLSVLRLLASHAGPMTATAVAEELELPRSTAYHLLAELCTAGFVTHLPEERRYGLGVAAFEVGSAYLRQDPLQRLARLPAAQVRALFPTTSSFVNRTGRGPRDLPALRRLLAAERRRGWAVEDGYVTAGFASVAVAVLDHGQRPVAAISVTFRHHCPDDRNCDQDWPELAAQVNRAATELTLRIGGREWQSPF